MKTVSGIFAFCVCLAACNVATVRAEEAKKSENISSSSYEIESQLPCFLFGGYQFSVGKRYQRFRLRVSVVNSGRANFETYGIDRRNMKFKRSYDTGSFSVSGDYFLNSHWFSYITLQNNRWLLTNDDTSATIHINTIDAGLGTGLQYYFHRNIFVQLSFQLNYRAPQSLAIESEDYTIPSIDCTPGVRLGVRL